MEMPKIAFLEISEKENWENLGRCKFWNILR